MKGFEYAAGTPPEVIAAEEFAAEEGGEIPHGEGVRTYRAWQYPVDGGPALPSAVRDQLPEHLRFNANVQVQVDETTGRILGWSY